MWLLLFPENYRLFKKKLRLPHFPNNTDQNKTPKKNIYFSYKVDQLRQETDTETTQGLKQIKMLLYWVDLHWYAYNQT